MSLRKPSAILVGTAIAWGLLAAPALAHVHVEADPATQGATGATLKVAAAAESSTAGITKLDLTSDPAIHADQVTLVDGPDGWVVSPGSQGGFAVGGAALPTGEKVEITLKVTQLPSAPEVVVRVLQTYSDGAVERWIESPGPDGQEPAKPAAVLKLSAAGAAEPAVEEHDEEALHDAGHDHATKGASLPRTGSGSSTLTLAGGLLLLVGGGSILLVRQTLRR